jgi:hypothetical protein
MDLKSVMDRERSLYRTILIGILLVVAFCCSVIPIGALAADEKPPIQIDKITIGEDTIQTGRKQLIEVLLKNYSPRNRNVTVKLNITLPNQLIITFGEKKVVAKAKTDTRALLVYPIDARKAGSYVVAARIFSSGGTLITNSTEAQEAHFFAEDAKHKRPKTRGPEGEAVAAKTSVVNTKEEVRVDPRKVHFDLPDLYIAELPISNNNSILRGETAHIRLVISNDGGDVAENVEFSASWYYQHRPRRRFNFFKDKIGIIAPGERKIMSLPLTIPEKEQKGKYLVHAVLDKPNYIKELNEDNNEMTSKEFINFADIALEFPDESHSFAEDGRFLFQWRSRAYNQFKVQISVDEEFLDIENTFELPKGQKWESARMIKPLAGEMPALAVSLMEQNDVNYLFWRVKAKNSNGESTVSTSRKFFINLLAKPK